MSERGLARSVARSLVRQVAGAVLREERRRRRTAGAGLDARDLLPSGSTFIRGLSIGALVGAAIAGSTIWERRHRHRRHVTRDAATASERAASPARAGEPAPP